MFKLSDICPEIRRKFYDLIGNHLFLGVFLFLIVFWGTFGIWITPVLMSEKFVLNNFINEFNAKNLFAYSLTLLVTILFDKVLTIIPNIKKISSTDILIWEIFYFILCVSVIGFLFICAFKSKPENSFTWYAFFGTFMVLSIWVYCNVDNPSYQKNKDLKASSGGEEVDISKLGEKVNG